MEENDKDKNRLEEPAARYAVMSPEEYLELDTNNLTRHEYYDGHVEAMAGAGWRHNKMVAQLIARLHDALSRKSCHVLPSDMRVRTPSRDGYFYPDLSIVCNDPEIDDSSGETLLNPMIIIEILSPSTTRMDKGRKLQYYQTIPSLREYLIIDLQKRIITIFKKNSSGQWVSHQTLPDQKKITLASIETEFEIEWTAEQAQ